MAKRIYPPKKQSVQAYVNSNHIIDLLELRQQFGKDLSPKKRDEIEKYIKKFAFLAYFKYAAGAAEHKNNLSVEVAKKELIQEAIDTFVYAMKVNGE